MNRATEGRPVPPYRTYSCPRAPCESPTAPIWSHGDPGFDPLKGLRAAKSATIRIRINTRKSNWLVSLIPTSCNPVPIAFFRIGRRREFLQSECFGWLCGGRFERLLPFRCWAWALSRHLQTPPLLSFPSILYPLSRPLSVCCTSSTRGPLTWLTLRLDTACRVLDLPSRRVRVTSHGANPQTGTRTQTQPLLLLLGLLCSSAETRARSHSFMGASFTLTEGRRGARKLIWQDALPVLLSFFCRPPVYLLFGATFSFFFFFCFWTTPPTWRSTG